MRRFLPFLLALLVLLYAQGVGLAPELLLTHQATLLVEDVEHHCERHEQHCRRNTDCCGSVALHAQLEQVAEARRTRGNRPTLEKGSKIVGQRFGGVVAELGLLVGGLVEDGR